MSDPVDNREEYSGADFLQGLPQRPGVGDPEGRRFSLGGHLAGTGRRRVKCPGSHWVLMKLLGCDQAVCQKKDMDRFRLKK